MIRITTTTTITTSAASSSAPPRLELGSELEKPVSCVRGVSPIGRGRGRTRTVGEGPTAPGCARSSAAVPRRRAGRDGRLARLLREGVERRAGAVANGVLGNAEHLRDLGVALALAHQQQQHRALVGGEVV